MTKSPPTKFRIALLACERGRSCCAFALIDYNSMGVLFVDLALVFLYTSILVVPWSRVGSTEYGVHSTCIITVSVINSQFQWLRAHVRLNSLWYEVCLIQ